MVGILPKRDVIEVAREKLREMAGSKPFKEQDRRIRSLCAWRDKATSAVRHMLGGERGLSPQECEEIELAHSLWCAKKAEALRAEIRRSIEQVSLEIERMESRDPEFYRHHIAALRASLSRAGELADGGGG